MTRADLPLLRRWVAMRVRLMLRTPRVIAITFALPLMLVLLFNALNSGVTVAANGSAGGTVPFAQFYTPSIGIFGLTVACYSATIMGMAQARESGLLKRVRGTPLPMPVYLTSWLVGAALTGIAAVVLMFVVAVPVFGVDLYARMLPAAIVTLVIGSFAMASLGLAVASLVKSTDQAMPVAQLTLLPMTFISGVFYPLSGAPEWLIDIARVLPLYHLVDAFNACFVAQTPGAGFSWGDLAVLAAWGIGGLRIATRRFAREDRAAIVQPATA